MIGAVADERVGLEAGRRRVCPRRLPWRFRVAAWREDLPGGRTVVVAELEDTEMGRTAEIGLPLDGLGRDLTCRLIAAGAQHWAHEQAHGWRPGGEPCRACAAGAPWPAVDSGL
ncbi:MAG: hypothetical protein HY403_01805 [Elusimicrobia bacterium]|nr:hypothetical protein [Elusimicrobiota bacterium]